MKAYGGVKLPKTAVEQIADNLKIGKMQFGLHHDPRQDLDQRVVDAFIRTADDGNTEAVIVCEIDQEMWHKVGGDEITGFSVSGTQPFLGEEESAPGVIISADAHWFPEDRLRAAYEEFTRGGIRVQARRLYQFSAEPPALIIATFLLQQLSTIPAGVLASYIYDSFKKLSGHRKQPSKFFMKFDKETGRVTEAYLETSSDEVLKHAIDSLLPLTAREGSYEYLSEEETWKLNG